MIEFVKGLTRDTLKKKVEGNYRWSRTSLTMFSAWLIAVYMVMFDLYKEGFRYDVFVTMVGVALGSKLTDSISKKMEK